MDLLELVVIVGSLLAATASFIFVALKLNNAPHGKKSADAYSQKAEEDVEHIFNDEFRQELRNRGRLHFEKIIGENSMFLQQDLRLTTSQLNEYMKSEVTRKLEEAFSGYEQSIADARNLAVESISKTQEAIEEHRKVLGQQLSKEVQAEKARIIKKFEENMADIVNHYVLAAVGNQIDLNDQLEFILSEMEANKKNIIEDISRVD